MCRLIFVFTIAVLVFLPTQMASATQLIASGPYRGNDRPVKVMTRNLYLGADILPVASATSLSDLMRKAAQVFGKVQATDFPVRAKVLAQEIQDAEPDLIGLQTGALSG
jgi:hypothetical protein